MFGSRFLGAGIIALSLVCLAGNFDPDQPVPRVVQHREALAYGGAAAMNLAGVALLLIATYLSFAFLVQLPLLFADASSRLNWSENALHLALVGLAWVVFDAGSARRDAAVKSAEACRHAPPRGHASS